MPAEGWCVMTPAEIVSKMSESIAYVFSVAYRKGHIPNKESKLPNDKHICLVLFGREIAQESGRGTMRKISVS